MITDRELGNNLYALAVTAKRLPRKHFPKGLSKTLSLLRTFYCLFPTNSFVEMFMGYENAWGVMEKNTDISDIKGHGLKEYSTP